MAQLTERSIWSPEYTGSNPQSLVNFHYLFVERQKRLKRCREGPNFKGINPAMTDIKYSQLPLIVFHLKVLAPTFAHKEDRRRRRCCCRRRRCCCCCEPFLSFFPICLKKRKWSWGSILPPPPLRGFQDRGADQRDGQFYRREQVAIRSAEWTVSGSSWQCDQMTE